MAKPWYQKLFGSSKISELEGALEKARLGDVDAQFGLGLNFATRNGSLDYSQAAHWFLEAANQGHSLAQFNLALMLASGQGVGKNDTQALAWRGKSAAQGDAGAKYNLGLEWQR